MGKVRPENLVDRQNEILFGFYPKDFLEKCSGWLCGGISSGAVDNHRLKRRSRGDQ